MTTPPMRAGSMSRCSLIHELDLWPEIASGSQFALIFVAQRTSVLSLPTTNTGG